MKLNYSIEKEIREIKGDETLVSFLGVVVSIDPSTYMLILDDGTGAISVSSDNLYDMEQVLRVIGSPYKEGGQIIVDSEVIQDFTDFNLELFKKVQEIEKEVYQ
ncbi:MAG: replication protein RepA [Candidatus Methanofastidiosum sp.]|nr:replication protein RepA [Methanofastidiosum sp.]NYT13844.1 replication protein RepA [Candidatus Methanofastidiosa archaeon]